VFITALELNFNLKGFFDKKLMKWQNAASTDRSIANKFFYCFLTGKK